MTCPRLLVVFAQLLLAGGAMAAPATTDDDKRQTQAQSLADASGLPTVKVQSPAEVVRFSVAADMLSLKWLSHSMAPMVRVILPNDGIIATLQRFPALGRQAGTVHGYAMLMRDFSAPGSLTTFTSISSIDGRLQVSRDFESSTSIGSVQLIEDAPTMPGEAPPNVQPVRLFISRSNKVTQQSDLKQNLSGASFVALCHDHPSETGQYLRPILHDLGQEAAVFAPDPAAIWQALAADWKPDAILEKQVNAAVAKFDAEDFQERQSAARQLNQLGEPAALTLMHVDRSKFSAAETSGVDTFLAPYLPHSPGEAERLGKDPEYLLDAQYSDDLLIRKLAASRLAKLTGHATGIDPTADDDTRLAQVQVVRQANPTTAP